MLPQKPTMDRLDFDHVEHTWARIGNISSLGVIQRRKHVLIWKRPDVPRLPAPR